MNYLQKLTKIPNSIVIILIRLYQKILSPSMGILRYLPFYPKPSCIFYPTCSEYSIISFTQYPFLKAFRKSFTRVLRCHPGNTPCVDHP